MTTANLPEQIDSTSRIEAFSDGIFSVAITLLAIDLKAPLLETISNHNLLDSTLERWPEYLAVVSSFASVLLMWMSHHEIFKKVAKVDVSLMLANGLLLLLIIGVPYPTSIMSRYILTDASHYAAAFFAGYSALINLAFWILWRVVAHNRRLLKHTVSEKTITTFTRAMSMGVPVYVVIALVAFISPLGSVLLCNAMWIYWSFASMKMQLNG